MTDSNSRAVAGWYPVAGTSQLRWWDGTQWTEHTRETAGATPYVPAAQLTAPANTNTNTVWAFLAALLPLLSLAVLPWYFSSLGNAMQILARDSRNGAPPTFDAGLVFSPAYFAVIGVSFATYVATVLFGYLDWRALKARGVPSPFHWAWGFLEAPLVYLIGRSVVVRRRAHGSLAPLWVMIAVIVLGFVVSLVSFFLLFAPVLDQLSRLNSP